MKLETKQFSAVLNACKRALSTRKEVPVLASYCFTGTHVYAYDGFLAIVEPFESDIRGALPGSALRSWVSAQTRDLEVDCEETCAKFRAGRRKLSLPMLGADAFAFSEMPQPRDWIRLDEHFAQYISAARIALGTDDAHPWRYGITVSFDGDERVTMYATDNTTIVEVDACYQVPASLVGTAVTLPPALVETLAASSEDPHRMGIDGPWIVIEWKGGRRVMGRVMTTTDVGRFREAIDGHGRASEWAEEFVQTTRSMDVSVAQIATISKGRENTIVELQAVGDAVDVRYRDGAIQVDDRLEIAHESAVGRYDAQAVHSALVYAESFRIGTGVLYLASERVRMMVFGLLD